MRHSCLALLVVLVGIAGPVQAQTPAPLVCPEGWLSLNHGRECRHPDYYAPPPSAWHDGQFKALVISSYAAIALDTATTTWALRSNPHAYESNPLMRGLAGHPARQYAVQAGVMTGCIWLASKTYPAHPRAAKVTLAIVNALIYGVAVSNATHVR